MTDSQPGQPEEQNEDISNLEHSLEQLSFEGMTIDAVSASLKSTGVSGLGHLSIGDIVKIEVDAVCVGVNHLYNEKLGGVRAHVLQAQTAKATQTL